MTNLEKLFESKPMKAVQKAGMVLQTNKVVNSITSGMMGSMNLILCGAIFTIISSLLNMAGIISTDSAIYTWLNVPYNMTMNIMAISVAFFIGYNYSKSLNMKSSIANGIVTMILFLMVAAPVKTVTLADKSTMSVLDTSFLGATGLFTAIIVSLISIRIIKLCQDKKVVITMPDSVPQFLQDSFSSLIPLVICVVLWTGLNTLVINVTVVNIPSIIIGILSIPCQYLMSVPGMFVINLICCLLWTLGIHGGGVVYVVMITPMITAISANAAAIAAGGTPVFDNTMLYGAVACAGGCGNVLALAIICLRSKSEQLKAVGKAGVIPAVFNISEPMIFGTPIMYNPILAIPFVLNPLVITAIFLVLYKVGVIMPTHILIMTSLPVGLQNYAGNLHWSGFLMAIIGFVVSYLVYYPFVKVYDKQLLAEEREEQ